MPLSCGLPREGSNCASRKKWKNAGENLNNTHIFKVLDLKFKFSSFMFIILWLALEYSNIQNISYGIHLIKKWTYGGCLTFIAEQDRI